MGAELERTMPKVSVGAGSVLFAVLLAVMIQPQFAQYLPGAFAIGAAAIAAVLFLLSVALHELAHACVARAFGARVREIALTLFGGHTTYEGPRLSPSRSMLISLSGPATNAILALILSAVARALTPVLLNADLGALAMCVLACHFASTLNWALAIFNVLPGLPMDGGRALEAILRACGMNSARATIITGWVGRVIAVGVVVVPLALSAVRGDLPSPLWTVWSILIALSLFQGASQAIAHARFLESADMLHIAHVSQEVRVLSNAATVERERSYLERGGLYVDPDGVVLAPAAAIAEAPADYPVHAVLSPVVRATVLDGRPEGSDLLAAMQADEAPAYLVRNDAGQFVSVIFAQDVARALNARG